MGEDENEIYSENLIKAKFSSLKLTTDGYIFLDMFCKNFPERIETVQNFVDDQKKVFYKMFHHNFLEIESYPLDKDRREIYSKSGYILAEYIRIIKKINNVDDSFLFERDEVEYDAIFNFLREMELIV